MFYGHFNYMHWRCIDVEEATEEYDVGCFQNVCVFFTPHVSDVMGVIVLASCVSVCVRVCVTTLTADRTDIQT